MLQIHDESEEVLLLQRALNELTGKNLTADGQFGKLTEQALRFFQQKNRLPIDGIYNDDDFKLIDPLISRKYIRQSDIEKRAIVARLPVDVIKAFKDVEAKSAGFLKNGKVVILFERHKFYKYLAINKGPGYADQVARSNPSICNKASGGYLGNEREYPRIERAISIDKNAALMSASYGLFQIMGFNHALAGYSNVESFVAAMELSEANQLDAVLNFIKKNRSLKIAVQDKNYDKIANLYNGAGSAANNYSSKLKAAARKYA